MAGFLSDENSRNVIPRWRDFKQTMLLGELAPIEKFNKSQSFINSFQHQKKINDWQTERSVKNAIELLNSSYVLDDEENSRESALFLQSSVGPANPINILSHQILVPSVADSSFEQINDFEYLDALIKSMIQKIRLRLNYNQNNPISWIELARLYLIIGKEKSAQRCILVAVQLAPDNRYISRASSRFFTHIGDYKMAKKILKANVAFAFDPWLISADIGISSLQNKNSFHIKRGKELISSKDYSPFELNELLSALATVELNAGSTKNSKRLFNESLNMPNDNTLAQAVWAKRHIHDIALSPNTFERVPNIYEAKAYYHYHHKQWAQSMTNVLQWFIDQPFSRDPASYGSFLACSVIENYDEAIKLCIYGLKATPDDFGLMNNLAFSYLKKGMVKEAQHVIGKIHFDKLDDGEKVVYYATKGLMTYKLNNAAGGAELYEMAIQLATKIKNHKYRVLAEFHHLAIQLETNGFPADKIPLIDKLAKEFENLDEAYLMDLVKNLRKKITSQ
jgi:hypothetical protein